jgi:type IV secretory pathway VirB3-like protein
MPIEPVKIPQNVYIEDRIVGPLTLKQIIISMLGIGFSYAVWASIAKVYGYVPWHITVIVWIPGVLSVIFAFVKIHDLTMAHIILLFLERAQKPSTRIYGPRRGLTVNARSFAQPAVSKKIAAKPMGEDAEISKLSAFLDQEGMRPSHVDQPEDDTAEEPMQQAAAETQGSSIPARPVDKNRVKVSPLLQADIADLETSEGKDLFRDVFHPPASHA